MNFTQKQITENLQEKANEKDGFNTILKVALEILMNAERKIFK